MVEFEIITFTDKKQNFLYKKTTTYFGFFLFSFGVPSSFWNVESFNLFSPSFLFCRTFLLKILKQTVYEDKIRKLRQSEFTAFRSNNEARRCLMRVLCFEVEEQFLLSGTTLRQQHPIKWYSMVKKGEIVSIRNNEPELGLLFDVKYKVTSSCLLLLMPRNQSV